MASRAAAQGHRAPLGSPGPGHRPLDTGPEPRVAGNAPHVREGRGAPQYPCLLVFFFPMFLLTLFSSNQQLTASILKGFFMVCFLFHLLIFLILKNMFFVDLRETPVGRLLRAPWPGQAGWLDPGKLRRLLEKLRELPYGSEIPLLGIYSKNMKTRIQKLYTRLCSCSVIYRGRDTEPP